MAVTRRTFLTTAAIAGAAGFARAGAQTQAPVSPVPTPRDWVRGEPVQYPDPDIVARFYREIRGVSQLAHPHVVLAYDAGPIGRLTRPHQMWSRVVGSSTMNLSSGERPVWRPVRTTRGPSAAMMPSPRRMASS